VRPVGDVIAVAVPGRVQPAEDREAVCTRPRLRLRLRLGRCGCCRRRPAGFLLGGGGRQALRLRFGGGDEALRLVLRRLPGCRLGGFALRLPLGFAARLLLGGGGQTAGLLLGGGFALLPVLGFEPCLGLLLETACFFLGAGAAGRLLGGFAAGALLRHLPVCFLHGGGRPAGGFLGGLAAGALLGHLPVGFLLGGGRLPGRFLRSLAAGMIVRRIARRRRPAGSLGSRLAPGAIGRRPAQFLVARGGGRRLRLGMVGHVALDEGQPILGETLLGACGRPTPRLVGHGGMLRLARTPGNARDARDDQDLRLVSIRVESDRRLGDDREEMSVKYLLFVCWESERMNAQEEPDPSAPPQAEEESFPWLDDLRARSAWLIGDQLAPPRRARSVRVRDGKTLVTDGPFAETKEAVGGFDVIECGSLEEAVEIAAAHPVAQIGTIEVRPLWGG
jgi:hypothetical protein